MQRLIYWILLFFSSAVFADYSVRVPILVYHHFKAVSHNSMTLSTKKFEEQLSWLRENHYNIVPLQMVVQYLQGKMNTLPPKPVVITVDDGGKTAYTYLLSIAEKYHFPVTLFIYPTAISHAKFALTWDQLKTLQKTGLFDIQSHTVWHPNFKQEKKHRSEASYQQFVQKQLVDSKKTLEEKLGKPVTLLAWPFGIYNNYLEKEAEKAGYAMAFSISHRHANRKDEKMAMPRYMIIEAQNMKEFSVIVRGHK